MEDVKVNIEAEPLPPSGNYGGDWKDWLTRTPHTLGLKWTRSPMSVY